MPGSSSSVADPVIIINTIIADVLREFADILDNSQDFNTELNKLIRDTVKKHKRIIFNGNNYSEEWEREAEKEGLLNIKSTVDAVSYLIHEKNVSSLKDIMYSPKGKSVPVRKYCMKIIAKSYT